MRGALRDFDRRLQDWLLNLVDEALRAGHPHAVIAVLPVDAAEKIAIGQAASTVGVSLVERVEARDPGILDHCVVRAATAASDADADSGGIQVAPISVVRPDYRYPAHLHVLAGADDQGDTIVEVR